jgi:histone-lysine N-methyltransferase SETD1
MTSNKGTKRNIAAANGQGGGLVGRSTVRSAVQSAGRSAVFGFGGGDSVAAGGTGSGETNNRRANDRQNRLHNRKYKGFTAGGGGGAGSDIFSFDQLKQRKKRLKFGRSRTHAWGLFADEAIEREDFVIEYVGELVRANLADRREAMYEAKGLDSSYLFKIDDDTVVDATVRGSAARFINHSCDPNCYTKIISIDGQKRIVIYAKTIINPGEELTYDYCFNYEEDKIPCNCGAKLCRGFLN